MVNLSEYLEVEQIYAQALRKQAKTLAVCAANPGEGVTTVALALAKRFAIPGQKTLLVDMNYCRPALDQRFAFPRHAWSSQQDSAQQAIAAHDSGVDVLTAALSPDAGLRQQDQLRALISHWAATYSVIVFDTSPLNVVNRQNVPAENICSVVDGTILVMQAAKTKEADILQALSKLKRYQVEPIGWVMNDRECPSLASEMRRELERLAQYAPRLARWLEQRVLHNDLINKVI